MSRRILIASGSQPRLARGARRHFDAVRGQNIIQGPERILVLDEIACAVLDLCDGSRSVNAMAITLAARYQGNPTEIEADITAMLQDLADKGLISA